MDPDETLERIYRIRADMRRRDAAFINGDITATEREAEDAEDRIHLVAAFDDLDGWLTHGGHLPRAWHNITVKPWLYRAVGDVE